MKGIRLPCMFVCLILLSQEQHSFQQSTSVKGVVVESATNRPLEQVQVTVSGLQGVVSRLTSDNQGRFTTDGLLPGRYHFVPSVDGYVYSPPTGLRNRIEEGAWLEVSGNVTSPEIELRMVQEGVIFGRVLNDRGEPLLSTSVSLLHYSYAPNGKRHLQDFPKTIGTRADDQGRYRFAALREGDYYVRINGTPVGKQPIVYYFGTTDEGRASPIHVVPGRELDAGTMVIQSQTTRQVRFSFAEAANPPLMRQLAFGADVVVYAATSRAGGRGQILLSDVAVGEHDVLISWDSSEGLLYSHLKLNVQNTDVDQSIVMKRAPRVTGIVTLDMNDRRSLVTGARCLLRPDFTRIPYRMDACLGTTLIPGSYWLELEGVPSDAYVVSVTGSGRRFLEGIQIESDINIEVAMSSPGGRVEGDGHNAAGQSIADAVVALVPEPPLRRAAIFYKSTASDIGGRYVLNGITPGKYRLYAWSDIMGGAYLNEDFLSEFEEHGKLVSVEKGSRLSVNVLAQ